MWKLHRYYLRELTANAVITFLVMFTVVLVSAISRGIQRSQGGDLVDAAKIILLFALDSLPHLITIAFLVATVLTYSRAAQDRELVAIRAAGVPPRVPMMAAVLLGMLLSVFGSVALHYVIPDVHFRKYRVIADTVRNVFLMLKLGSDRIPIADTGYVMTFRHREGMQFEDCTIYCPTDRSLDKDNRSSILRVERVTIEIPQEGEADIVIRPEGVRDPIKGTSIGSTPITIPLQDLGGRERRDDRDDDLRSDQLLAEVLRDVHPRPETAVYTLFRRCCFSLMPVMLAPVGFCIAELTREKGRVMALVLALIPLAMFYVGEVLGARLLLSTKSPWCAWMPMLLLAVVAVPLCWRQLRR